MPDLHSTERDEGHAGAGLRAKTARFLGLLRENGYDIGLAELRDALRMLTVADLRRPREVEQALACLLCGRLADWQRFRELFEAHWLGEGMKRVSLVSGAPGRQGGLRPPSRRLPDAGRPKGDFGTPDHAERGEGPGAPAGGDAQRGGASRRESLAEADLRHISDPDELAQVQRLAERLARRMRKRLTRRERTRRHGHRLDLRRTIHRSIAHGGTPLDPAWRRRRDKPLRLVLLLDVSGSMSLYSSFFIRFIHAVLDQFREAEAFVFHTRLIHVTPALTEPDPAKALERLALMAQGWAGGTRIGESLASFNRWHAQRVITSRTAVMIMSDGYDTGPPAGLAGELAALRRRCKRIVWLNPMIGWAGYEPTAGGMAAALPYLDLFAPAHNLESLAALEPYLSRL